jgi:hypothetical protein
MTVLHLNIHGVLVRYPRGGWLRWKSNYLITPS